MGGDFDEEEVGASCVRIYFTDFFEVEPDVLNEYGAFNVSLVNDLPLFIDPFLLFDSENNVYRGLHEEIIRYVKYLRDRSMEEGALDRDQIVHWFHFPEVKQNWLGFSRRGNAGSGLGADFAAKLYRNLRHAFRNFGEETIPHGSHLEKLALLNDGVGRDHLSDFTTNVIKRFLLNFTQDFARAHLAPEKRKTFAIDKVWFDYASGRWQRGKFELPAIGDDFVLLTPRDILTKDEAWINRDELIRNLEDIYNAAPDAQLRGQLDRYLRERLKDDATAKERNQARAEAIERYPQILDYYILQKEDDGDEAHKVSNLKVRETYEQFVRQVKEVVTDHLAGTEFYQLGDSFEEALKRIHFLKNVIENKDGYRLFYDRKGRPLSREPDLQLLYRLTWYGSPFDVNREVNNGRGPVDYKVSFGAKNATLIEFELASNSKLRKNLQNQVAVYSAASDTSSSIKVILYFSEGELRSVKRILKDLELDERRDVVLIDARGDNKPSASNA